MDEQHWSDLHIETVALLYALRELRKGVRETAPNDSPAIRRYLEAGGIESPARWCAAFCNWCAEQAAVLKGVTSPLEQVDYQAYVESYYRWARKHDLLVPVDGVAPGNLFLLYDETADDPVYEGPGRHVHMGFVREPPFDSGSFQTVEGNSNEEGSAEGVRVASNDRRVTEGTRFVGWAA
jgi:hypothetical protein